MLHGDWNYRVARCCEIKFSSSQREQKIADSSPFDFAPGGSVFFGSSLVGVCKFWDCLRKRFCGRRGFFHRDYFFLRTDMVLELEYLHSDLENSHRSRNAMRDNRCATKDG